MSSKVDITNSINTIDDGGQNTASEVRAVFETLNDEFFSEVETISGTTLLGFSYDFKFLKQGNTVILQGELTNNSGLIETETFTGLPSKYRPLTNMSVVDIAVSDTLQTSKVIVNWLNGNIRCEAIMPNVTYRINLSYISNND